MPPRRDHPTPPSTPASPKARDASARDNGGKGSGSRPMDLIPRGWSLPSLPRPSWRNLKHIALLAGGAVLSSSLLGLVWKDPDKAAIETLTVTPASLAPKPHRPITLLVIGIDADRIGDSVNHAAPAGPASADALLLVRVNPKGPLQVLNLPVEMAVKLPGNPNPVSLGSVYQEGGVALTAGVVREVVGLGPSSPERFAVIPRATLRMIVDRVGGLELSPPQVMRYKDKSQKFSIDLQSGLQRLDGGQVEQMVRFRDRDQGDAGRRIDHQLVESGLRDRLKEQEQLAQLPELLRTLQNQVETNLTAREALSLLAAGLDDRRPIAFSRLALKPATKEHGTLRQLDAPKHQPLWNEP